MISFWLAAPKGKTLIAAFLLIGLVALVDAHTGPSLAVLYILPIMLGAKDVAFPRLNLLSLWCWIAGALFFTVQLRRLIASHAAQTVPERL